jgi:hypothetical protein
MKTVVPIRKIVRTVLCLGIFLYCTASLHGGFVALMLLPFFAVVWIWQAISIARNPDQRTLRVLRVIAWMLAFCLVGLLNLHWYRESRAYADKVVAAVSTHYARTGNYPTSLEQVGIQPKDLNSRKWRLSYGLSNGRPYVFYAVPYIIFDMYDYDFQTRKWNYLAD